MSNQATTSFRTKTALKAAVGRMVEDSSTNGAALINDFIDLALEHALTLPDFPPLVRWHDSAASVSATGTYIHAPKHARELIRVVDTTAPFPLNLESPAGIGLWTSFSGSDLGGPTAVSHVGDYGIKQTIPAGSALELVSSGSDTRSVTVRGILGDEYATVTTTLTGATPVAVSSTWDDIFQLYVDSVNATRTISLRLVTGSTVIGTIGPGELDALYHRLRLNSAAGTASSYRIIYKASPQAVGSDSEQIFPGSLGVYCYHWACGMFFEKRRQGTLAEHHFALAKSYLDQLCMEWARQRRDVAVPYQNASRPSAFVVLS